MRNDESRSTDRAEHPALFRCQLGHLPAGFNINAKMRLLANGDCGDIRGVALMLMNIVAMGDSSRVCSAQVCPDI